MKLFGLLGKSADNLTLDQLVARLAEMRQTAAGVSVDPESAMQSPTVYSIVNLARRTVAMLPLDVVEVAGDSRHPVADHQVSVLFNRRPNPWQTPFQFKASVLTRQLLWGNFYAIKESLRDGTVRNLMPQPPASVTVRQLPNWELEYVIRMAAQGQIVTAGGSRVFHVRDLSCDDISGVPLVEKLRESIALEIAAEKFGAAFFGSGALPVGVIEHPGTFRDEESRTRFAESWKKLFSSRKRTTPVLEGGLKFTPLQFDNEKSQFLDTRKLQREVLAGAFGVPPHMIAMLERATNNNIEQQSLEFVIYCLTPWLVNLEQQIARDLLTPDEQETLQVKFNVGALLRGDRKSRQESLKIMRDEGVINANEWRALEDMNPIPGPAGEVYLQPLNMWDASKPRPEKPPSGNGADPAPIPDVTPTDSTPA